jgi:hypothetical protein
MLVHVQTIKQNQESKDEFLFRLPQSSNTNTQVYSISKRNLCSAIQMLQKNEYTSILSTGNFSLILRNTGTNKFSVTYSTRNESYTAECKPHSSLSPEFQSSSLPSLLTYLYNQMLPIHKECVLLSGKMQNTFGFISHHVKESTIGSSTANFYVFFFYRSTGRP